MATYGKHSRRHVRASQFRFAPRRSPLNSPDNGVNTEVGNWMKLSLVLSQPLADLTTVRKSLSADFRSWRGQELAGSQRAEAHVDWVHSPSSCTILVWDTFLIWDTLCEMVASIDGEPLHEHSGELL